MKKAVLSGLIVLVLLVSTLTLAYAEEQKPTLKFLIASSFYDLSADAGWATAQATSGYDIEFEVLSGTEQLMLIIASGEPYDYVYLSPANYNLMMSSGAILDITDLLSEHGNEITNAITTLWPASTVDGRIYAIPSTVAQPGALQVSILARKDLLDKANIAVPTTLAEFYDCLVALKAAYPDMIPLTADNTGGGYFVANIAGAFGITGTWQEIEGSIIPVVKHPRLKDYLIFMNKLYSEELLDSEMPALDTSNMKAKWTSSRAVMFDAPWNGIETVIGALRELVPEMDYINFPILIGEDGTQLAEKRSGVGAYGAIPVTSEHPADAIKAINNMIKFDNFTSIALGIEGVHHTLKNGEYSLIQPAFNNERVNSNVFIAGFYREDVYPKMWEARLGKNADLQAVFKAFRDSIKDCGVNNPVSLAPAVTVVDNKASLDTYVYDALTNIVAGVYPIEYVDQLIEYWNTNGGKDIEDFYNEWYYSK